MKKEQKDKYNAEYPARKKAIEILETIAEMLNQEDIFDCKNGDTKWYDFEDKITEIIDRN